MIITLMSIVSVEFKISHYKLEKSKFDLTKNTVAMCAKSSPIKPMGNLVLSSARWAESAQKAWTEIWNKIRRKTFKIFCTFEVPCLEEHASDEFWPNVLRKDKPAKSGLAVAQI